MENTKKRSEKRRLTPTHIWMIIGAILALTAMMVVLFIETWAA